MVLQNLPDLFLQVAIGLDAKRVSASVKMIAGRRLARLELSSKKRFGFRRFKD